MLGSFSDSSHLPLENGSVATTDATATMPASPNGTAAVPGPARQKPQAQMEQTLSKGHQGPIKTPDFLQKLVGAVKDSRAESNARKAQIKTGQQWQHAIHVEVKHREKLDKATQKHDDSVAAVKKAEKALSRRTAKHDALVNGHRNRHSLPS